MISGTIVYVLTPVTETDSFNNEVVTDWTRTAVDNVLIQPGATADLEASRPAGITVDLTLHFPKSFTGDLRGCNVELTGRWAGVYSVVGEPQPYMPENTPTSWNYTVEVVRADG